MQSDSTPFRLPRTAMPGAGFPAIPGAAAGAMLAVLHQLQRTQYVPPAERRALQFQQIAHLVEHIDRAVPHYGVSLWRAGLRPGQPITEEAWRRVPILTRAAVQEAGAALHAKEVPPAHGSIASATTSGSSGRPVTIRKTALSQVYWQCFVMREQEWHARDLSALWLTVLRDPERAAGAGPLRRMADWGEPLAAIYPTGPAAMLDYRCAVAEQVEIILREKPVYLTTFPSLLLEWLRETRRSGARPEGLRQVRTTGEALSPAVRALGEQQWGVPVVDTYSAAEIGIIASSCPERNALHVQEEGVLLEVLRDDGSACAIGEEGRVVLTPLHNFAMPLLRYEIGDRAVLGPPCACGRTLPVLAQVPGRARDMLTLPDGSRRFPYYAHNAIMRVDAIAQHQVAQVAADRVEIRLVVRCPLTAAEEAHIVAAATEALGAPFRVDIVYRDSIARGSGGKFAEFTNEAAVAPA